MSQSAFKTMIKFFSAPTEGANRRALEILDQLEGVEVVRIETGSILASRFELPFVETADRERYYGISGIELFAKRCRAA